MAALSPFPEQERLETVKQYQILDTEPEQSFDDLAGLASLICNTPIALISLIDSSRQWFKSAIGIEIRETPLAYSICAHAVLESDIFVVPDTLADPRFSENPLCISDPHFRFYAGAQLWTSGGRAIGTICVLDNVPRANLGNEQMEALRSLSRQVVSQLELRRTLHALQESEKFANSVVEVSPDCVKILDLEGRILSINAQGRSLMELDDFSQLYLTRWLDLWTTEERGSVLEALNAARGGNRARFEAFTPTLKGTPRWWESSISSIPGKDGKPAKLICVSRDITERRRIEEGLRHTAKLESLGLMAGGVAHDFNNLLTGILGNATLLADLATPEMQSFTEEIVRASERAANLTNQMLAYAGKGRFHLGPVNLSTEVREIVDILKSLKHVHLVFELDDELPLIQGDAGQIQGVIMNLVINAAEALPPNAGSVRIATYAFQENPATPAFDFADGQIRAGNYVCLEVGDTGSGMTPEILSKAFDPFFTTKFTGRGLGLAAVLGVARGLDGVLRVRSKPEQGTVFQLLFPVIQSSAEEDEELPPHDLKGQGTILVVDDEEMVRTVAKVALERQGYRVIVAPDGPAAMIALAGEPQPVSLILLDLTMPGMNGRETLDGLRRIRADVPVIVSSGYDEGEAISGFAEGTVFGFLRKPYRASKLAEKIKAVLHPEANSSQFPN